VEPTAEMISWRKRSSTSCVLCRVAIPAYWQAAQGFWLCYVLAGGCSPVSTPHAFAPTRLAASVNAAPSAP